MATVGNVIQTIINSCKTIQNLYHALSRRYTSGRNIAGVCWNLESYVWCLLKFPLYSYSAGAIMSVWNVPQLRDNALCKGARDTIVGRNYLRRTSNKERCDKLSIKFPII